MAVVSPNALGLEENFDIDAYKHLFVDAAQQWHVNVTQFQNWDNLEYFEKIRACLELCQLIEDLQEEETYRNIEEIPTDTCTVSKISSKNNLIKSIAASAYDKEDIETEKIKPKDISKPLLQEEVNNVLLSVSATYKNILNSFSEQKYYSRAKSSQVQRRCVEISSYNKELITKSNAEDGACISGFSTDDIISQEISKLLSRVLYKEAKYSMFNVILNTHRSSKSSARDKHTAKTSTGDVASQSDARESNDSNATNRTKSAGDRCTPQDRMASSDISFKYRTSSSFDEEQLLTSQIFAIAFEIITQVIIELMFSIFVLGESTCRSDTSVQVRTDATTSSVEEFISNTDWWSESSSLNSSAIHKALVISGINSTITPTSSKEYDEKSTYISEQRSEKSENKSTFTSHQSRNLKIENRFSTGEANATTDRETYSDLEEYFSHNSLSDPRRTCNTNDNSILRLSTGSPFTTISKEAMHSSHNLNKSQTNNPETSYTAQNDLETDGKMTHCAIHIGDWLKRKSAKLQVRTEERRLGRSREGRKSCEQHKEKTQLADSQGFIEPSNSFLDVQTSSTSQIHRRRSKCTCMNGRKTIHQIKLRNHKVCFKDPTECKKTEENICSHSQSEGHHTCSHNTAKSKNGSNKTIKSEKIKVGLHKDLSVFTKCDKYNFVPEVKWHLPKAYTRRMHKKNLKKAHEEEIAVSRTAAQKLNKAKSAVSERIRLLKSHQEDLRTTHTAFTFKNGPEDFWKLCRPLKTPMFGIDIGRTDGGPTASGLTMYTN